MNILQLYLSRKGRVNRAEYAIAYFAALAVFAVLYRIFIQSPFLTNVVIMPLLGILCFILAIKRFHDVDRSGWHSLLLFIPVVGFLVCLYLLFKKGTTGPNRFGPPSSWKKNTNDF